MDEKNTDFSFFFKRLQGKNKGVWRKLGIVRFPRKTKFNLQLWLVDGILFKIISVLEAVVLVSELCVYY
ncbi:hypothetical protein Ccrd_020868, partial [Cynara cardunculus var. scolymus]